MDLVKREQRQSGIEILKIIAILLVVISHVTQTLVSENTVVDLHGYVLKIGSATTSIQMLIINIFYYFGASLGNTIFFICTAWFLVSKEKPARRKALHIFIDVWAISVLWLAVVLIDRHGELPLKTIVKQLIPTTYANNWYMTCYIIFLLIYPLLNTVINNLTQRQLLRVIFVAGFLWIGMNFLLPGIFFTSKLIIWTTIYFIIAYLKLFLPKSQNSKKVNIIMLILGLLGFVGVIILTNILGLHIAFFSNKLLRWNNVCNPFGILIAIGALNLLRQSAYRNGFVNYVSRLSMFVYLIHENQLFRRYYRPVIWKWIYDSFGYNKVGLWILLFSLILFIAALVVSALYKISIQKLTAKIASKLYFLLAKAWILAENWILDIK